MVDFFKPEDFKDVRDPFIKTQVSHIANDKLACEGKVVQGISGSIWGEIDQIDGEGFKQIDFNRKPSTHQALLINIKPIVKCEHPKERVALRSHVSAGDAGHKLLSSEHRCECGAKVQPTSFEEIK